MTSFSHLHDFEAAPYNHIVPHWGIFSKWYLGRVTKSEVKVADNSGSYNKNQGPPYYRWSAEYDELEHNTLVKEKGLTKEDLVNPRYVERMAHHVPHEAVAAHH